MLQGFVIPVVILMFNFSGNMMAPLVFFKRQPKALKVEPVTEESPILHQDSTSSSSQILRS